MHPATRRLLAGWGYRYNVWHLRRFPAAKRNAIVICFLQAARAETTDAIIEMQDKLITSIHNKARKRYDGLLRTAEEARSRAVEVVEELGTLVLDDPFRMINCANRSSRCSQATTSPDWWKVAAVCALATMVHLSGCPSLVRLYAKIFTGPPGEDAISVRRKFSVGSRSHLSQKGESRWQSQILADAPVDFLPRRWVKHVVRRTTKR